MSEYIFQPIDLTKEGIKRTSVFLGEVFSKPLLFQEEFLQWQYVTNPSGKAIGYNAFTKEGVFAAHYAVQPFTALLNGKESKAALSLNTATAPKHQGKKLFTSLANLTYTEAAKQGVELITGVANSKSIHGLENKLGFTNYGALNVAIGFNKPVQFNENSAVAFETKRTNEKIQWRLSHPLKKYTVFQKNDSLEVLSKSGYPAVQIQMGVFKNLSLTNIALQPTPSRSLLKLWMGLHPSIKNQPKGFLQIPLLLRPSPLYLSMKKLSGHIQLPVREEIFFQALDFDVY